MFTYTVYMTLKNHVAKSKNGHSQNIVEVDKKVFLIVPIFLHEVHQYVKLGQTWQLAIAQVKVTRSK